MAVHVAWRPSDADVQTSVAALKQLFDVLNVQEQLRTEVVRFTRAHARRAVPSLDAVPTHTQGEPPIEGRSDTVDADALLEVAAVSVALEQVWDLRPDLGLVLVVRARLIRRPDGRELYAASLTYRGGARPMAEWTADDCRAVRQQLARASEALAERMVDEIFLVDGLRQ
jgi:hypothetical protein